MGSKSIFIIRLIVSPKGLIDMCFFKYNSHILIDVTLGSKSIYELGSIIDTEFSINSLILFLISIFLVSKMS